MLAGVSVPLIALTWGWRWAFALAGVLAIAVAVAVGPHPPRDAVRSRSAARRSRLERRGLVIALAVAFGLGASTSSAVTTFYVGAAVRGGTDRRFAGTMLAVASVVAIAARVACGITCDRLRGGHLRLCAGLLALGSVGIGLLSLGAPNWMAAGSLIALAGTWGLNGVFWYALLRSFPRSPGRITGALAPGALLGSTAGPITFGVIAEQVSYAVARGIMALVALVAAAAMVLGARSLPRPAPIVPEPLSRSRHRLGPEPPARDTTHDRGRVHRCIPYDRRGEQPWISVSPVGPTSSRAAAPGSVSAPPNGSCGRGRRS